MEINIKLKFIYLLLLLFKLKFLTLVKTLKSHKISSLKIVVPQFQFTMILQTQHKQIKQICHS